MMKSITITLIGMILYMYSSIGPIESGNHAHIPMLVSNSTDTHASLFASHGLQESAVGGNTPRHNVCSHPCHTFSGGGMFDFTLFLLRCTGIIVRFIQSNIDV
jgi:hypothetical protein